ncbi:pyrroloquinoline quinone biosynthesis protein PqqB [Nitrospira moscoviensis]|uniref:Coenzyme PQQ synthesis protein B n=1 Tax=Nitrospira moscoviensis TaxID=42253 RepID=A0A0K2G8E7_NITMO|nr:pyrroloquinoline quinone biosynthesis protein PqqB [Nitrospira moscoviensis]ALA57210.1 Coenzyme PQQ synthesis protein B [Nitrospira moscoviensis]
MLVHVLGSAAGGGFPQWNCACLNCRGVRNGTIQATARTQSSVAVQGAEGSWFLIHASPDIRAQLAALPALHPRTLRDTPLAGLLLTNGDLDQTLGLFSLREGQPLHLYATDSVRRAVRDGNVFSRAFDRMPGHVTWHELKLDVSQPLLGGDGRPSLWATALAVPGKVPLYLESIATPQPDMNIALLIRDPANGRTLGYAPCVGAHDPAVDRLLGEADCLFFDGTFWAEDELPVQGLGRKTARDMAHWPVGGPNGSLAALEKARARRKILIHLNNSNPLLRDDTAERREVEAAGVDVAYDGMEVEL